MKRVTEFIKKADTAKAWMTVYGLLSVFLLIQMVNEEDGNIRMWMAVNILWIVLVILHLWQGEIDKKIIDLQNKIIEDDASYIKCLQRKIEEPIKIKK